MTRLVPARDPLNPHLEPVPYWVGLKAPAKDPVKEAEAALVRARQDAIDAIFTTPIATKVAVMPQPIDCPRCKKRPAEMIEQIEDGTPVYYYARPAGYLSDRPLCGPCEAELRNGFHDGLNP